MNLKMDLPRHVPQDWANSKTFGEPNFVQWEDDSTGLVCCAIRDERGLFYAGYVGVESKHPAFGLAIDELPRLVVHGGVSFSGAREYLHWLGFHCCHRLDIAPGHGKGRPQDVYRNLAYVQAQCQSLAKQLMERETLQADEIAAIFKAVKKLPKRAQWLSKKTRPVSKQGPIAIPVKGSTAAKNAKAEAEAEAAAEKPAARKPVVRKPAVKKSVGSAAASKPAAKPRAPRKPKA
mgnify:CR=1 FL=1